MRRSATGSPPRRPRGPALPDPFVHLHVASGYSLQYGASHPATLVERAAEQEMDTLALTDRDGVYGAVRFAKACITAGVRPILGVDLAMAPPGCPGLGSAARRPAPRCAAVPSATPGCPGRPSWPAAAGGGRRCAG